MAYVITDTCTKDELCVQACPVDCIHPKQDEAGFAEVPQLYVKPDDRWEFNDVAAHHAETVAELEQWYRQSQT